MTTRRLRLAIVTPAHWKAFMGGAQYQVKCILDALVPRGRYEIDYFARRTDPEFIAPGYRIHAIGRGGTMPRWGYLADSRLLYRALATVRPDVIYQRVGCGYTGISAYYARQHGARLIWHVAHDTDVEQGAALGTRNPIRAYLEKRSIEYGIRHAAHIITQTDQQAAKLRAEYGRTASAVIPNFHPDPEEALEKSGPLTVLWVANFKQWKRPEAFLQLAHRLRDLAGVRFVMVGASATGADSGWNDRLMRSLRETLNVEYLGQRSQAEVNALLARAHLFVNTSEHEGFANTFIQAWMREVPVITLSVNPDGVFDREEVGICAGDEERLASVVRELSTDHERRTRMAKQAGIHARDRHSVRNMDAIVNLIEGGS